MEELSTPDPGDWVSEGAPGGTLDFVIFALGASLILLFTVLNFYALPLGTVSPQSVYDNAGAIYGSEIEVLGTMEHSNEQEFTLHEENSTAVLEVVWLGGYTLPLNGTRVVATGQIIEGTTGPAMMCDRFSAQVGAYTSYENPWALPSLRMLSSVLLWFLAMIFATGLLALLHLRKRTEEEKHRIVALTEACTMAAGILTAAVVALLMSEPELSGSAGIFTYCAAAAFALLLISSITRKSRRANLAELANPMPVIAAIVALLGLLLSFLSIQLAPEVTVLSEAMRHLPDFAVAALVGTSGLIFMSIYIVRRKSELSAMDDSHLMGAEGGA